MVWRAESRAEFQNRPVKAALADVNRAILALERAPRVEIAGVQVAVLSETVPELPEAAARIGMPFIAYLDERGGRPRRPKS